MRATSKTSYFLAQRHEHKAVCALLRAMEEADHPDGVPEGPKRKPGMIPASPKRKPASAAPGGEKDASRGKGRSHGKKIAKQSSTACVVM